jgi:NitT/TauT family transport system substrate-binding protein
MKGQPVRKTALLVLTIVMYSACGSGQAAELKKASLLPQWLPQAQFAGYMVALSKGYYRDAGIDLTLLRGGPGSPPFKKLLAGEVTFCTGWLSNGIQERASGMPVVNIAQIIRRSALMLVARKSSGILKPADLNSRKVGLWAEHFYLQPAVFFKRFGLTVEIIPNYTSVNLFLKGGVEATAAMWYNEYHAILNSGLDPDELTVFFFRDYGLKFPEDGLYCLQRAFEEDPDMCRRFVDASLRGWLYAFDHEEEALDIVMKSAEEAHTGTNRAHQRWMLKRMRDLITPEQDPSWLGKLDPAAYDAVGKVLVDFSYINRVPEFDDFSRGTR